MADRRAWDQRQDQAIRQLVKKFGNKRWAIISHRMSQTYGLKGRSGKQCRERWHNHLDETIKKTVWTQQEEQIIFDAHRTFGNKWTQIAKQLQGRTDNSIKNHFYSTLRRSLRRINKLLGSKNSTSQMRDIKPSALSKIFEYADVKVDESLNMDAVEQNIYTDCKGLSQALLQFANYKPVKDKTKKVISLDAATKSRFEGIIKQIMDFNEAYEKQKMEKNKRKKDLLKGKQGSDEFEASEEQQEEESNVKKEQGVEEDQDYEQNLLSVKQQSATKRGKKHEQKGSRTSNRLNAKKQTLKKQQQYSSSSQKQKQQNPHNQSQSHPPFQSLYPSHQSYPLHHHTQQRFTFDNDQLALDIPQANFQPINYEGININSTPREGSRNAAMFITHLTPPPMTPGNLFTGYTLQRGYSGMNMSQKLSEIYNERREVVEEGRSSNRLPSPTANSGFKSYVPE